MAEADKIFSSNVKYDGIFNFKEFYKFCYNWLAEETGLDVAESKYKEKINGPVKDIDIEWKGSKKLSDYFKFEMKIEFKIIAMSDVEINQNGKKVKMNKGEIGIKVGGTIVRDYDGKFETTPSKKFLRSIYEKWVIPSRIEGIEGKIVGDSDEFLGQAKAFLDIEGRK